MLTFIPLDDLPTGNVIKSDYNHQYGRPPFLISQSNGFWFGYVGVYPVIKTDGWLYTGSNYSNNFGVGNYGSSLLCYKEWLPTDRYSGFSVYFGFRIKPKSTDGFKQLAVAWNGATNGNTQRVTPINELVVVPNREYYIEIKVTVPPTGASYIDSWLDGQRKARVTVSNAAVENNFRSTSDIAVSIPQHSTVSGLNGDHVNATPIKDIYIGTDQAPNPMRGRLGPITVQSHYPKVDPDTTTWESTTSELTMDEILSAPITDINNPFPHAVRTKDNYVPLQLKLGSDSLDPDKRYVGAQVHYHAMKTGDLSKTAHISMSNPGVIGGTQEMDMTEYPWLGTAFRPTVIKTAGVDMLTASDLSNATITITPVNSLE